MKIGKLEKEIIAWLDEQNESPSSTEVEHKFARYTRNAGERAGHSNFAQIWHILEKLEEKGFLVVENPNRTNSRVIRTEKPIKG